MLEETLEAWRINNRVNLLLIENISAEGMGCTLSKRGGRNVTRQFTHVHNVRLYQLEKRARALAPGLTKFATADEPTKRALVAALKASAKRVEEWFRGVAEGLPGMRTQKRGLVPTLGYLIAHESHHRGIILLTLKQCGHALDKNTSYGIWDWNNV